MFYIREKTEATSSRPSNSSPSFCPTLYQCCLKDVSMLVTNIYLLVLTTTRSYQAPSTPQKLLLAKPHVLRGSTLLNLRVFFLFLSLYLVLSAEISHINHSIFSEKKKSSFHLQDCSSMVFLLCHWLLNEGRPQSSVLGHLHLLCFLPLHTQSLTRWSHSALGFIYAFQTFTLSTELIKPTTT